VKELVGLIARGLVDRPDDVVVREREGSQETVCELVVAREDLGKIIGKQGRTARALRAVVAAAGSKLHKRVAFEIVDQ
jgi:predicted RNA-binding protein YlqC (UPF0109 family)